MHHKSLPAVMLAILPESSKNSAEDWVGEQFKEEKREREREILHDCLSLSVSVSLRYINICTYICIIHREKDINIYIYTLRRIRTTFSC